MKSTFIIGILLFVPFVQAQKAPETKSTAVASRPTSLTRSSLSLEYQSWTENFLLKTNTTEEGIRAHFYGFAAIYDRTTYKKDTGWGWLAGYMNGFGVAGSQTSGYFQNRVRTNSFQGGIRYFWRINPRVDIGPTFLLVYKNVSWPVPENGNDLKTGGNPLTGIFVESRWRLSTKWQVVQAFGTYSLSSSMAWRLGAAYTF